MEFTNYKGFTIWVNSDGTFEGQRAEDELQHKETTWEALKKYIDKIEKTNVRQPAIYRTSSFHGEEQFREVEITSVIKDPGKYSTSWEAWIQWQDKEGLRRKKANISYLFRPTKENLEAVATLMALETQIDTLIKKANEENKKLIHFKPSDFGYSDKE